MKQFKNALRVSVLFILLLPFALVSCGPGGAAGGDPIVPNPTPIDPLPAVPKIESFIATPVYSVHFNGLNAPAPLTATWSTSGATAITINDLGVSSSGSRPVVVNVARDTTLKLAVFDASGTKKAEQSLRITSTIDPVLEQLSGKVSKSYKLTTYTKGSTNLLTSCLEDDIFNFYPNCQTQTNYGTDSLCSISGFSNVTSYSFDVSTMMIHIESTVPQPDRKVEFASTPTNTMKWTFTKADGFLYTMIFTAL